MNNFAVNELDSEKHVPLPSISSLLKISLGLILFTMISTALVYAETMSVDVEGNSFNVEYSAEQVVVNGVIAEYEPNNDYAGLIISVDVTGSPGTLELTLDRSFMDSIFDGIDDDYFVLVDGLEPNFTETTNTQSRTLNIEVPFGTEDIEIIGTVFGDDTSTPSEISDNVDDEDKAAADKAAADKAAADAAAAKAAADKAAADKAAAVDTPKTQCGPGTILQDGACVLDERCGPGTILKDGACILDTTSQPSSSGKGLGSEFAMGMIIAIAIAGAILVILAMIAIFGNQFNKWTK